MRQHGINQKINNTANINGDDQEEELRNEARKDILNKISPSLANNEGAESK